LSAALVGWSGSSYGDEYNVASYVDGNVQLNTSLEEALSGNSPLELCSCCSDPCDCSEACSHCCAPSMGSLLDNTVIFAGADTYKSIGERLTNINGGTGSLTGSFGGLTGFNTGFGIGESALRGQIGASYGLYDPRGRIRLVPQAINAEEQVFITAGVYKRGDMQYTADPLSYGVVVDAFMADNWGINANELELGQLRGIVGWALNDRFEVGGFGTAHVWDHQASVTVAGAPGVRREVRAANQMNGYLRGNTPFGASLMGYAGAFDRADIQAWQFGLTGDAPLSQWFSLYGNFNYAVPSAGAGPAGSGEEQFAMQIGLAYYFGGKAASPTVTGQRGLPLLDVANNSSFLITD